MARKDIHSDVEGHAMRGKRSDDAEPDTTDTQRSTDEPEVEGQRLRGHGAPVAEVEGHPLRGHSDENLKQTVVEIENALEKLRALLAAAQAEVEGHPLRGHSDENLKQTVVQIEKALEKLRALLAATQEDVEGHPLRRS